MSSQNLNNLSRALGFAVSAESIIEKVQSVYTKLDEKLAQIPAELELPCKQGCDACCHESVFLSAPEFLVVSEFILRTFSADERNKLNTKMNELADAFEDELELLETISAGAERDEVAARIKFRCPLLDEDGSCRIYTVRELNGRSFGHAWDSARDEAYGCSLTRERLRVLDNPKARLVDARWARQALVDAVPNTECVQVYPWWFKNYGQFLLDED